MAAKKISFQTRLDRDTYHQTVQAWVDCRACPLHEDRIQTVHLRGQVPATVVFIGEGPGESEDALGFPFVGPAGRLLDDLLEQVPLLDHHRVAFVNLVACVPRDEARGLRPPSAKEVRSCGDRLEALLDLLGPRLLVALGKEAHRALRAAEGDVPGAPGAKVVSLIHPSAILRKLEDLPTQAALDEKRFRLTLTRALEDL